MKSIPVKLLIAIIVFLTALCVFLLLRLSSMKAPIVNGDLVEVETPSFKHVGVVDGSSRRMIEGARDLIVCYRVVFPSNAVPEKYNGVWFPSKFVNKVKRPLYHAE